MKAFLENLVISYQSKQAIYEIQDSRCQHKHQRLKNPLLANIFLNLYQNHLLY